MVKYPKIFGEIDVISLQQINIRNSSNVVAPDGYVLGQSTGKALMLPLDYLFNYVSTPINASLWANYPAVSTIDVSGNNIINSQNITISNTLKVGSAVTASGLNSVATGCNAVAYGVNSHAEGIYTSSIGQASHAEGYATVATGPASHAEGSNVSSIGVASHAEGLQTQAIGDFSHSEGFITNANGLYSHAEGRFSYANNTASHSEGSRTNADGLYSHAEGERVTAIGQGAHGEGYSNVAFGAYSHAEGQTVSSIGIGSHAEGLLTRAIGNCSHAEGASNVSFGTFSHAAGSNCSTIGIASFAHGLNVNTTGSYSVGFGVSNEADANASLVVGIAARAKIPGSMTYATGGFAVPAPAGTAQTVQLNLLTNTTTSVENPLKYNTYTGTTSNIRINIADPYYYLNKVEFTLTGYESKPSGGGGGVGLGLYSASYGFYIYWDIQNTRVAYIVDQNSASSATSGGNITLVATSAKNLLTPGSDTVTVKGYMTADASGADYALTVESSGYNANWLAQLRIGDLMVSNV